MKVTIKPFYAPSDQMAQQGCKRWSVSRLFELVRGFEVIEIPLTHLNIAYTYDSMSLRELAGHALSIKNADLKFPIILDEDGSVLDGRHRVMKALLEGKESILAVRFKENPTPCEREEGE